MVVKWSPMKPLEPTWNHNIHQWSNHRATIEQPKRSHHYSRLAVTFSQDGASAVSLITVADGVTGHDGGLLDDPIDGAGELLNVLVGAIKELLDVPINATAELLDVPVDAAVPHVVVDVDGAGRGGGLAGRGAQLLAEEEWVGDDHLAVGGQARALVH